MPIPVDAEHLAAAHRLSDDFDDLLKRLVSGHAYKVKERPAPPKEPGVYLLADGDEVLHVGRTGNLQSRRRDHTAPANDRYSASFAFRLAREAAASHDPPLPTRRAQLESHPGFLPYFTEAKARARASDFRCVIIEDPATRALFEIFASVALNSPHNDWHEH